MRDLSAALMSQLLNTLMRDPEELTSISNTQSELPNELSNRNLR